MTDLRRIPGFAAPPASSLSATALPAASLAEDTGPPAWSVGGLLAAAGQALAARFAAVAVRGEICNFTRAASGHCYFALKDAGDASQAALRCAMFRRAAQLSAAPLRDGLQVELRGRLAVYEPRGELQMVAESARLLGAGQLYEEFLRLRARLAAEGLFAPERKRALTAFPRTVGVVTSTAGAALHDVLTTLARRAPHVAVIVYPCLVQGPQAPDAVVAALRRAARRGEVDTLIVCRGGGSLEDLWAFNDERVVRAIAAAHCPVVSGVGHETDLTLADLAADVRAATPTAAAQAVAAERAACLDALAAAAGRLSTRVHQRLDLQAQRLDAAAARLSRPAAAVAAWRECLQQLQSRRDRVLRSRLQDLAAAVDAAGARLVRSADRRLSGWRATLHGHARSLQALDPQRVLERGYARLRLADGRSVISVQGLEPGQAVEAVLRDGVAALRVESTLPGPADDDGGPPLAGS